MNCPCDSPDIPDCVANDPAIGFNMYRSAFGLMFLFFLIFAVYNGLKYVTGAKNVTDLFRFLFRGLFAVILMVMGKTVQTQDAATIRPGARAAEVALYVAGFTAVFVMSYVATSSTAFGTTSVVVVTLALAILYAGRTLRRFTGINTGSTRRRVVRVAENQDDIGPPTESDTAQTVDAVYAFVGGAVLGLLGAFITSLARFLRVRNSNPVGDTWYIVTGIGVLFFLFTYYGSTVRVRGANKRATEVIGPDGVAYELSEDTGAANTTFTGRDGVSYEIVTAS